MKENFNDYFPVEKGKEFKFRMPGGYSKIFEARKNSNIYIKDVDEENINKVISEYKFIKKNFNDLLPENQLVIYGKDKNSSKACILMEKVHQEPIKNYYEFVLNLDSILERIINFYIQNLNYDLKQKRFLVEIIDIFPRNIIWGKTSKDKKPRIYFIDNYPSLKLDLKGFFEAISMILNDFGIKNPEKDLPKTMQAIKKLQKIKD
jgi:hypothetical protein